MNYQLKRLLIGTLAENQEKVVLYHGEILCVVYGHGVLDLINRKFYDYLGDNARNEVVNGETYVCAMHDCSHGSFNEDIFCRKTLIRLAQALNEKWTSIAIPSEDLCKVKRKK